MEKGCYPFRENRGATTTMVDRRNEGKGTTGESKGTESPTNSEGTT